MPKAKVAVGETKATVGGTWFAAHIGASTKLFFGLGSLGILAAGVLLSASSWMSTDPFWGRTAPLIAVAAMALGLVCVTLGGFSAMQGAPAQNRSEYAPFIFGLGILMAGVGGTGVVGVAGLIHSQQLAREQRALDQRAATAAPADATDAAEAMKQAQNESVLREREERRARFVLLAGAMAFIGSLFYIALALWRKQHSTSHREPFDVGKLVSGAALRCGEALLFVLVFVLLTQVGSSNDFDGWLPVMGLMLGMFVKSGERLVFNLATRIFHLAESLVPAVTPSRDEDEREDTPDVQIDGDEARRPRRRNDATTAAGSTKETTAGPSAPAASATTDTETEPVETAPVETGPVETAPAASQAPATDPPAPGNGSARTSVSAGG